MDPLSVWTFYRRHKRRAALLLSLISMMTAGVYLMTALVWAIFIEPGRSSFEFLSRFSLVMPGAREGGPDPAVVAKIRAHPGVAKVIPASAVSIALPQVMAGGSTWFSLLGLMEEDLPYVLARCSATLVQGQLPARRTNGLLLSEEVAASLSLHVGDTIHNAINSELYGSVVAPLEVVGILQSDVRLGIVSLEYLYSHEVYREFPTWFLVVAQQGREAAVDDYLRNEIRTVRTDVQTLRVLNEAMAREYLDSLVLLGPIIAVVTIALALVIATVNQMALSQRLGEFGILHAAGLSKGWLIRRLTMEAAALASAGWAMGVGLSWLVLYVLQAALFAPRGHDLNVISWAPIVAAIPIPVTAVGSTSVSVKRVLSRLDPVAVVERGQLSQEGHQRQRTASVSSPRPLASATFYSRHRRRAVLLIGAMGMVIMAVVLLVFVEAVIADARAPGLRYLSRVSRVYSLGGGLDPGVVAQVKTHPAVERAIPVAPRYHMLSVHIPPFTEDEASPFGVYAEDMAYLVGLYDLELKEGHLPRPRTNEMVISEIVARNRDLQVGDVIGDPDRPAYPGAERLDAEFVVSGILARASAPEDENWLGFVSLEFLESHQAYRIPEIPPLIVVPKAGQKDVLDDWLENELAGRDAFVLTFRQETARAQQRTHSMMLAIALLEGVIAIVAAVALAALNYIYISQRQSEFGVLHALGYSRARLVWRTVQETLLTTGAAWGLSAVLFLAGLLYLQYWVFRPSGLRLDLLNLTPWLFTLPIPVAVLAATSGTAARTLSRLDPVSIIERRS